MGIIKNAISNWKAKKEEFKQLQRQRRMEKALNERELSSEERELNDYLERQRQARIKELVKKHRENLTHEFIFSKDGQPLAAPNVMKNHKKIFSEDNNIFKNVPNFLKQRRLFME